MCASRPALLAPAGMLVALAVIWAGVGVLPPPAAPPVPVPGQVVPPGPGSPPLPLPGPGPEAAAPADLAWVPATSAAFVHVRFADFWNSPLGGTVRKSLTQSFPAALDEAEKALGVPLTNLAGLTLVVPEGTGPTEYALQGMALRVTTSRPYPRGRVLAALRQSWDQPALRPAEDEASDYRRLGELGSVHFIDDQNFLILANDRAGLALLAPLLRPKGKGPLAEAVALAGKYPIAAAVNLTRLPRVQAAAVPAALRPLLPLRDARTLLASVETGDEPRLTVRLTFPTKEAAADGADALKAGLKLAAEFLAQAGKEESKTSGVPPALIKDAEAALKAAKVSVEGSVAQVAVPLKISLPLAGVVGQLAPHLAALDARQTSQNNLKQIGLALINYESAIGQFPGPAIVKDGKPLLSWRVAILPYVEQQALYKEFHLDEPWDSDHNKKLLAKMPKLYAFPGGKDPAGSTRYRVFVGGGAVFDADRATRLSDITDGTSNTLMAVEAAEAVPWTKPDELTYDPKKPLPKIGAASADRFNALFADGSVKSLRKKLDEKTLRLLIEKADGNPLPDDFDK